MASWLRFVTSDSTGAGESPLLELGDPVEDVAAFLGRRGRRLGGDLLPPDHGVVARDIALAFEGIELLGERLCRWSAPSGNRERTYSSM